MLTFWARARHLLWSWWPWALVSIWGVAEGRWGWAIGGGAMALVSYLIAPVALPPRFGLDHEFSIESTEFLDTIAGASGVPFLDGNRVELLNNGDAFYPRMLEAIDGAQVSITVEALYLLGRGNRSPVRAIVGRTGAVGHQGQDSPGCDWFGKHRS